MDFIEKKITFADLKDWSFKSILSDEIRFKENTCISDVLHFIDDDFLDQEVAIIYIKQFIQLLDSNGRYEDYRKIISETRKN